MKILKVYWQNPISRERFEVGELSYDNDVYSFQYIDNFEELRQKGFCELFPFLDARMVYTSKKMFSIFSSRLPDKKQIGIEKILKKYGLTEYNEFELLARSCGRVPGDTLEFIEPINEKVQNPIKFYIAGVSHYSYCKKNSKIVEDIPQGSLLECKPEPENKYDKNAVALLWNKRKLGYVPKYYSEFFSKTIFKGKKIIVKVVESNLLCSDVIECRMCVEVEAEILS